MLFPSNAFTRSLDSWWVSYWEKLQNSGAAAMTKFLTWSFAVSQAISSVPHPLLEHPPVVPLTLQCLGAMSEGLPPTLAAAVTASTNTNTYTHVCLSLSVPVIMVMSSSPQLMYWKTKWATTLFHKISLVP